MDGREKKKKEREAEKEATHLDVRVVEAVV